jgi:hypothetical protein
MKMLPATDTGVSKISSCDTVALFYTEFLRAVKSLSDTTPLILESKHFQQTPG